jgi:hypothetical protein
MSLIRNLLSKAFPLMAITGLLLAGWGLIITPDEIQNGREIARWSLKMTTDVSGGGTALAWR